VDELKLVQQDGILNVVAFRLGLQASYAADGQGFTKMFTLHLRLV
jgi:hypothetical protein